MYSPGKDRGGGGGGGRRGRAKRGGGEGKRLDLPCVANSTGKRGLYVYTTRELRGHVLRYATRQKESGQGEGKRNLVACRTERD